MDEKGAAVAIKDATFPVPFAPGLEFNSPVHGNWNIVHTGMLVPEARQIYVCADNCMRGVVLQALDRALGPLTHHKPASEPLPKWPRARNSRSALVVWACVYVPSHMPVVEDAPVPVPTSMGSHAPRKPWRLKRHPEEPAGKFFIFNDGQAIIV